MKKNDKSYDPIKKWMESDTAHHSDDLTINELQKIDQELAKRKARNFDKEAAWTAIHASMIIVQTKTIKLSTSDWVLRIAASVTLLIVAGYLTIGYLDLIGNTQINTLAGQNEEIYLPDSSHVYLNAKSSLAYKNGFEQKRIVTLEGEAYFEVTHGKSFIVKSPHGSVQVLGTKYNVIDRQDFFEVNCQEGKVLVTSSKGDTAILTMGQSVSLIKSELKRGPSRKSPSKITGRSEFDRMPLRFVMDEYERQFGISIKSEHIDEDQLYTGSFSHDNKATAIRTLAATLGASHQLIDEKSILLQGEPK